LRPTSRGPPRAAARGAPVVAEPGATLVAGVSEPAEPSIVRMEPGATLVSGRRSDRKTPAPPTEPPQRGGLRDALARARPAHLAIGAGVAFALLIGLLVLAVVLLSGAR